jgi:tRNA(fMet)-specific endonuclease VapC
MKYLLDTNVCIALINGSSDKVRRRYVQTERESTFAISTVVLHELQYGVAKSELVARNARTLDAFLKRGILVLDFDGMAALVAAKVRVDLERLGKRIGEYDTLIAGHALAENLVLVTANAREFNRVKGLTVEDWTA